MSNFRNNWKGFLDIANEELKNYDAEIIVEKDDDGYFSVYIKYADGSVDDFAENYFEDELEGCLTEAFSKALNVVKGAKESEEQTLEFIVDGEKKAEIKCNKEDRPKVAAILSQFGRYAAFHNYNFQFMNKD